MEKGGRGLMLLDLEKGDALAGAAAYTQGVMVYGAGRGGKPKEEKLDLRSLNAVKGTRGRKGKSVDLGFKPSDIVRI
jgi:topoisomerase-4 subunit A